MALYKNIAEGKYESKLPWVSYHERVAKQEAWQARHDEDRRLAELFTADLYEYHGVTGHPRADKCFSVAWSMGHSSGLNEVALVFSELVELIK